jgi:beta-mannosidase
MSVHVTNDETEAWQGKVRWALETLEGEVLVERLEEVSAPPLASTQVCSLDFINRVDDENRRDVIFVADLWEGDERIATQVATFVPNKHLSLADPELSTMLVTQDDQLVCEVRATTLARFVELSLEGVDVVWSDNYFDVLAGRASAATCPLPEGWTLGRAREALRARSLWDSFA